MPLRMGGLNRAPNHLSYTSAFAGGDHWVYSPKRVYRQIVSMTYNANRLLAQTEAAISQFQGVHWDASWNNWVAARCRWTQIVLRLATNTKDQCKECLQKEMREVERMTPCGQQPPGMP